MSRESKRLQKSRNDLSGNALIQHLSEKNAIFVFPVISGGTVKRVLIAYFIVNISAKNIKMRSRVSTLHQTRGVTFLGHSVYYSKDGYVRTVVGCFNDCWAVCISWKDALYTKWFWAVENLSLTYANFCTRCLKEEFPKFFIYNSANIIINSF